MVLPKTPPESSEPQLGEILQNWGFSLGSEGFMLHIRHPNSWDLHQRDEAPECLILKINEVYVQETQKGYKKLIVL